MNDQFYRSNHQEALHIEQQYINSMKIFCKHKLAWLERSIDEDADVKIEALRTQMRQLEIVSSQFIDYGKDPNKQHDAGYITIPQLDFVLTTRCTLKCAHCFHLIPKYKKPSDLALEKAKKDISHLAASVDYIHKVNLLGGEPFLYKQLPEILAHMAQIKNIGHLYIVTNGTVVPDEATCRAIKEHNVYVYVSDYGVQVSKAISRTQELFYQEDIFFRVDKNKVWHDFGEVKKREGRDLHKHNFQKCAFSRCKAIFEGHFHICAYGLHAERTGLMPTFKKDGIDIRELTPQELRNQLFDFYSKEAFECCAYCNAPNGNNPKIKPGIQLERK